MNFQSFHKNLIASNGTSLFFFAHFGNFWRRTNKLLLITKSQIAYRNIYAIATQNKIKMEREKEKNNKISIDKSNSLLGA